MMPYFVPTRFVWRFGGKQVHLCGSFTRWVETVPMVPVDGQPGMFTVLVHLPPGYHQYKFIVDGAWRHDESQPFLPDPLGNVNNWLYVKKPDASGAVHLGMHVPSAQRHVAASEGSTHTGMHGHGRSDRGRHSHGDAQQAHAGTSGRQRGDGQGFGMVGNGATHASDPGAFERAGLLHVRQPGSEGAQLGAGAEGTPGTHDSGIISVNDGGVLAPIARSDDESPDADPLMSIERAEESELVCRLPVEASTVGCFPLYRDACERNARHKSFAAEQACTRNKIMEFLSTHTSYELIPESGKVVVIDIDFSVRQAFHALHEQSIASAPLWDAQEQSVVGMISASDFIHTLTRLRRTASSGANLSDAEMDAHTIRHMREQAVNENGAEPKSLVFCRETDSFATVVRTLVDNRCSMAPIVSADPVGGEDVPNVLHIATISGVLASLMRHFRASFASIPLVLQPLSSVPIGSWSPDSPIGQQGHAQYADGRPMPIRVTPIETVRPDTPLTEALTRLLEGGISALPVVSEHGKLLDVYARADITLLAKGCAYQRLQWEDITVGHALSVATMNAAPHDAGAQGDGQPGAAPLQPPGSAMVASTRTRSYVSTRQDQLRLVLDRLSMPSVRRVIVVHPETQKVEGIISLSDVARFLFM